MNTAGVIVEIPGLDRVELRYLVLDVNGTITAGGQIIEGVDDRLRRLGRLLEIHLVSADTYGTLPSLGATLQLHAERVANGAEKVDYVAMLGAESCAVIGNGANDAGALESAALGICVVGPEGAAPRALAASDLVVRSVVDALDVLLEPTRIAATLRP